MRVLLDECVPRPLRRLLTEHDVRTVGEMGWSGRENGELLRMMKQSGFSAFVTVDQNLPYEQNLRDAGIAVIMFIARSNAIEDLEPLAPSLRGKLASASAGSLIKISHD